MAFFGFFLFFRYLQIFAFFDGLCAVFALFLRQIYGFLLKKQAKRASFLHHFSAFHPSIHTRIYTPNSSLWRPAIHNVSHNTLIINRDARNCHLLSLSFIVINFSKYEWAVFPAHSKYKYYLYLLWQVLPPLWISLWQLMTMTISDKIFLPLIIFHFSWKKLVIYSKSALLMSYLCTGFRKTRVQSSCRLLAEYLQSP